ncbi:MAG: T9SS type A sorting domain-containing protein, partial [Bacteroidetes bacterium]|nr:T9SS type A sorting domain-containing protein [Bacteroidota bacterium]
IFIPAAISQSFQLSYNGTVISNGTDIYAWGDSTYGTIITKEISVKNISSSSVSSVGKKIETNQISGTSSMFCFGTCYPSTTSESETVSITNNHDTVFSVDYKPKGHLGESIITCVVYNVNNINDSAWFVIHFNATPATIKEVAITKPEISNPYPNPAKDYTCFNYSFPKNTINIKFILQNIIGTTIKEIEIGNTDGKLTLITNDLKEGVYFYSFLAGEKLIITRKLVIRGN